MPHVRIHNATGHDLDTVVLYVPTASRESVDFGPLPSGTYSTYKQVPTAYRVAEIEVSGPGGSLYLRPYDYVGERPLGEGQHTYHLRLDRDRLAIDLISSGPTDE